MEDFFDPPPDPRLPSRPRKGRGAVGNVDHRFTAWSRQAEDDGWWQDETPAPATHLRVDNAKSILSWNESPDLGFDRSLNPYRGCEHGCVYCYARPTHAWLGLSPGLDFETRLFYKPDAVSLLRTELAAPGYVCQPIALGTATDAYQPVERTQRLTRALLEALIGLDHPATLVTKSALVARDGRAREELEVGEHRPLDEDGLVHRAPLPDLQVSRHPTPGAALLVRRGLFDGNGPTRPAGYGHFSDDGDPPHPFDAAVFGHQRKRRRRRT